MPSFVSLPQIQSVHPQAPGVALAVGPRPAGHPHGLIDSHGRTIRDLRLSITDRCNFRCVYCMDPGIRFADAGELMTVGEMERVVRACVALGVRNVRLTGGEPTVHPRLLEIIEMVSSIRVDGRGVEDLSMTTNGSLCTRERLREWKAAGLQRLTFSLDSVSPEVFDAMTRHATAAQGGGVAAVIDAIRMAIEEGFTPVKVNAVVIRGRNEAEVPKLAALAREVGFDMRFIEYMPLDSGRHWDPALLVPADEMLDLIRAGGHELTPIGREEASATAENYAFAGAAPDSPARIGIIAPVTRPFCGQCSRLRITADAKIRPCLFSLQEADLMAVLRDGGAHDRAVEDALLAAVWAKQAGHGITKPGFQQPARPMSAIGG
jgi:cyclic pyranopterin phosphate synthase